MGEDEEEEKEKERERVARKLFGMLDRSGSGRLGFEELVMGLSSLFYGSVDAKMQLIFQLYDEGLYFNYSFMISCLTFSFFFRSRWFFE